MKSRRLVAATAAVVACLAVVPGCTARAVDKSGGAGFRTLRLALDDPSGRETGRQVEELARQVRRRSDGRLRIEVVYQANGPNPEQPAWDQRIARKVMTGRFDLGLIPARSWDRLGVHTLDPLQVPFLVATDSQLDALVSDPVAVDMLAGLEPLGVTGLALVPESLRHPVGFGSKSMTTLADFAGAIIRAPLSDLTYRTLQALGSRPVDLDGVKLTTGVANGSVTGAETSLQGLQTLPAPSTLTVNVPLYAKADVIVVRTPVLDSLTSDERAALRAAAAGTVRRMTATRSDDEQRTLAACAAGASIALASDSDLVAMQAAVSGVRTSVASDPIAGPLLQRVEQVVLRHPGAPLIRGCERAATDAPATDEVDPSVLNGVWRFDVTREEILAAGLDEGIADNESGIQTVRLDSGRFVWTWTPPSGPGRCAGSYRVTATTIEITEESAECGARSAASYRLVGDRIEFTDGHTLNEGDPSLVLLHPLWYADPWRLIERVAKPKGPPDGVYRWRVDAADLLQLGIDPGSAASNSGVMTFNLDRGRFVASTNAEGESPDPPDCPGSYRTLGGRVTFTADAVPGCGTAAGGVLFSGVWLATGNGLRFAAIRPDDAFNRTLWGASWRRIRGGG